MGADRDANDWFRDPRFRAAVRREIVAERAERQGGAGLTRERPSAEQAMAAEQATPAEYRSMSGLTGVEKDPSL